MANYYASARTNYVKVSKSEQLEKLKETLSPFPIGVHSKEIEDGQHLVCFTCDDSDNGGWPSFAYDEDDNELNFSWEELVMPHIDENEVLVVMEVGAEKLRYLVGAADAYIRRPTGEIQWTSVSINDIYEKAKLEFAVDHVTPAEY